MVIQTIIMCIVLAVVVVCVIKAIADFWGC